MPPGQPWSHMVAKLVLSRSTSIGVRVTVHGRDVVRRPDGIVFGAEIEAQSAVEGAACFDVTYDEVHLIEADRRHGATVVLRSGWTHCAGRGGTERRRPRLFARAARSTSTPAPTPVVRR